MGVSRPSKDQVSAIARDLDADVSEADGLVLTVAMLWTPRMPERGEVDQGAGGTCPQAREQMAVVSAQINSGNPLK